MSHRGKSHEELLETIKAEALRDSSLVASKSLFPFYSIFQQKKKKETFWII